MSYVFTFVAADPINHPVTESHIDQIFGIFKRMNILPTCAPLWLAPRKAVDLGISAALTADNMRALRSMFHTDMLDTFINPVERRRKKLLVSDMDSTIVAGETLDELADYAGLKEEVAVITDSAMKGQLDFQSALQARVTLLKGLTDMALEDTASKMKLNPGAKKLVSVMRKSGAQCVLVSGGFSYFTERAAAMCGFEFHHGNTLEIEHEKLTGKVQEPILDKYAKVELLKFYAKKLSLKPEQTLAIGDGANDIPMLKAAGLGIGYQPKEIVAQETANLIIHGDLTAALYAQGFTEEHLA